MNENIKIVINCYEANIGNMTSSVFAAVECLLNKGVQTEIITDAIHKAVAAKKPSWGYIWGIIKNIIATKQAFITAENYEIGDVPW